MFCENCGTKLEDGALFCTNCGAKQSAPEVAPGFTPEANSAAPSPASSPAPAAPKASFGETIKKVPVYAWIIIAVVIVAAIVGGVFAYKVTHTIDINEYLNVEFNGYDTVGTVDVELDETFWEDLYEKASFKDKAKLEKEDYFDVYYTEGDYMQSELGNKIKFEVDPEDNLSNGDEVTVSWKVKTDSIKKKYGVTIKSEDKVFTVEELEEVESFDPFEAIEVTYSGISGDGEINIEVTSDEDIYDDFSFSASDDYYLSEGDVVTITFAPYYDEEDLKEVCAEEYGMVPTEVEKEYTVEGLGHYVESIDEFTETSLADLITEGSAQAESDANLSEYETLKSCSYKGAYLLQSGDTTEGNEVYLVFECVVDLTDSDSDATDTVTYYPVIEFSNVSINDEGVCAYGSCYGSVYNSFDYESSFGKGFYYYGFSSLDDVKTQMADEVSWYVDYYGYTLTDNLGSAEASTEETTEEEATEEETTEEETTEE